MKLAIKLYETETDKPEGIPDEWPSQVLEIADDAEAPDETYQIMTQEEYDSYRETHIDAYNEWKIEYETIFDSTDKFKDYKLYRQDLMIKTYMTGFSNLSLSDKKIAAENFAVSRADRNEVFTLEEQISHGVIFHQKSTEARSARRTNSESEVYNRLQGTDQLDLMSDVSALLDNYVKFGIEGTLEGDSLGLFDYIESRVGTPFESTGLLSKTYSVEEMTVSQLSEKLIDILKNGNY